VSKVFKAVGKAVSGVVKGVVKAVTGVVKAVVNVVSSVISFIAQPFMGLLGGMPSMPDAGQEAQRQQGVLGQYQGSNVNIPVVYGYRKVGGTVVFAETGSTNNRYLYVAYVFSEGLVEGLREVYIDDWLLPVTLTANLNAGQVVDVNAEKYNGRVRLQWYPGTYFTNINQSPVGSTVKSGIFAEAPSFKDTMDFNGLAVMFARYEWKEIKTQEDADNNPFSGSIPALQVSMLGKRVASLLVDAENFSYDTAPVRYSTNPAEILLDYLRNPRYGKGLFNDDIDWPSWKRAARKCNQTVTYLDSRNINGPILTCNYVLDTSQSIFANVKTLLMGFRAYMPYVQGKFKLRIEDAGNEYDILSGSAVIYQTITKDDLQGEVTYTGIEKSNKYNVVSIGYVDPDQKWSVQQVIYPETEEERQEFIVKDGGRENKLEATFPTLTNYAMAKDMARLLFNKSRRQETCSLTVTSKGLELEPGDNIRIQSNILDFGEDPWRIISVKVNDNMTVDLGCVRNPDDIYPHVRVGEEDLVLPTYVPKGSIIYFPGSDNRVPLGLVPPTNAVYPDSYTGTPTHPPNTDPKSPGGGGVGGGEPPGGAGPEPPPEEPAVPALTPVPPTNNVATPPPPPPDFTAVLTLTGSQLVDNKNNTYTFNSSFTQPQDGLYAYSIIWIRPNRYSPWEEYRLDTRPGPGGNIPWVYGPRVEGLYEAYARAFASDGRASSRVTYFQLSSRGDTRALGRTVTANETRQVTEGWTVPGAEVALIAKYDDNIEFFEIRPKLVGGFPQSTRRLTATIQQITNALSSYVNPLISGFRIYYKLNSDTYYAFEDFLWPGNYVTGQSVSVDLAGDFGPRYYPNDWSVLQPSGVIYAAQKYDFIVRLLYRDGTAAEKQLKKGTGLVEYSGGLFNFRTYGTVGNVIFSETIPAGFTIPTVDQDPNRNFAQGSTVLPVISSIRPYSSGTRLTFNFSFPKDSNGVVFSKFLGYKIRYRRIIPGTNPQFTEADSGRVSIGEFIIKDLNDFQYGQRYQFVITAYFYSSSGNYESDNSLVSDGVVIQSTDAAVTSNVYDKFNFKSRNTKVAIGELRLSFPALPTINAKSWVKKAISSNSIALSSDGSVLTSGTARIINNYYQLSFQPDGTSTDLICYRRVWNSTGATRTTLGTGFARYWQLGPWEKVIIPISALSSDAEGFKIANVRGPIAHTYFNPYYEITGGPNNLLLNQPQFGATGTSGAYTFPYAGTHNESSAYEFQFLFVLSTSGTAQTRGLMLKSFWTWSSGTDFRQEIDGFTRGVQRDLVQTVADFNGFPVAYQRNINQAFDNGSGANIPINKIIFANTAMSNPAGITVY
jgi:hypothetical protein